MSLWQARVGVFLPNLAPIASGRRGRLSQTSLPSPQSPNIFNPLLPRFKPDRLLLFGLLWF